AMYSPCLGDGGLAVLDHEEAAREGLTRQLTAVERMAAHAVDVRPIRNDERVDQRRGRTGRSADYIMADESVLGAVDDSYVGPRPQEVPDTCGEDLGAGATTAGDRPAIDLAHQRHALDLAKRELSGADDADARDAMRCARVRHERRDPGAFQVRDRCSVEARDHLTSTRGQGNDRTADRGPAPWRWDRSDDLGNEQAERVGDRRHRAKHAI